MSQKTANITSDRVADVTSNRAASILYGKDVSENIEREISSKVAHLNAQNLSPTLAILRIGEKPADMAYENAVIKRASKLGINTKQFVLPHDVDQAKAVSYTHLTLPTNREV